MRNLLPVCGSVSIPETELGWRFSRASGPGGQGVNTADSRVELMFDVAASTAFTAPQRARVLERLGGRLNDGVLTITAAEYRSQLRNRAAARMRLVTTLREALAPDPRDAPIPGSSRASPCRQAPPDAHQAAAPARRRLRRRAAPSPVSVVHEHP
jgi:ribosome-associated protein